MTPVGDDARRGGHRARAQPSSGIGLTSFKKQENTALGWFREGRNEAEGAVWFGGSTENSPCLGDLGLQQLFPKSQKAGQYPKG